MDVLLQLLDRYREIVLGPAVLLEQLLRHAIDAHVRGLRGEHHRDEELERFAKAKRDRGVLVLGGEALDDRDDAVALGADAPARLGDEAPH